MKKSRKLLERVFTSLITAALTSSSIAVAEAPSGDHAKYMGTGSCSSSNCHGGVQPRKSSNVLQNEYATWIKHDKHSKAYTNLLTDEAKHMASLLNIKDATKEPLCLKCHATYVPNPTERGERFQIEDGVSCESCHGAAEKWLESHAVTGATHEENVKNGLRDSVTLDSRAKLCLSCHYGDNDKTVTHDLYGAGHPRLSFELDTFGILQPKHWVVDEDYVKRKEAYVPMKAWFVGQVQHAQETVAALQSPKRSKNGAFPELSLFDCFSCHHSLSEDQWKNRSYGGAPGQLRLNLPSLVIVKEAIAILDPKTSTELGALIEQLHANYKVDAGTDVLPALKALLSQRVAPLVKHMDGSSENATKVLRALSSFAARAQWPKYEVAEQIGMGIQAVVASSPELAKKHETALSDLFATLESAKTFKVEQFMASAKRFANAVGK